MADDVASREAEYGKRMIEVKVRLWTDDLAGGKGRIQPKHAWSAGVVRITRNEAHGIVPEKPVPFNSLMEIPSKIEKVLIDHGIEIHPSRRMTKYIVGD
jgi:hypothetical protein